MLRHHELSPSLWYPPAARADFYVKVIMQDKDAQAAGPTDNQKLRDRIFQQRLWIEHLKGSAADRETVRRAIVDLYRLS
jgi:hypothetical protein